MKTNYLIALCAVPALVQTVSAEELSKVDKFGELMEFTMEIASKYIDILNAVKTEETTPAEAAPLIEQLAETMLAAKTGMQNVAASMSPEEQKEIGEQLADPEVVEVLKQVEESMKAVQAHLVEKEYFGSPELKAACEKLDKAAE